VRLAVLLMLSACGRLAYDPVVDDAAVNDGADDAAPVDAALDADVDGGAVDAPPVDARPDASLDAAELAILIDVGPHHLGDTVGGTPTTPEGNIWTGAFALGSLCTSATIDLDFFGPMGPNVAQPPVTTLNVTTLDSVIPFFTGCAADCDDFSAGPVHVSLPATGALVVGDNALTIACGIDSDDFFFGNVELRCVL
jgi:hypothetical protein